MSNDTIRKTTGAELLLLRIISDDSMAGTIGRELGRRARMALRTQGRACCTRSTNATERRLRWAEAGVGVASADAVA